MNEIELTIQMNIHFRISVKPVLVRIIRPVRRDMAKKATDAFVLTVSMETDASSVNNIFANQELITVVVLAGNPRIIHFLLLFS